MPARVSIASLALVAALGLAAGGCSGRSASPPTTGTAANKPEAGHAAPELEALLPDKVEKTKLIKGSTTGAAVFGSDTFSKTMSKFLKSAGKKPSDLRFANAQDQTGLVGLETGVFEVHGIEAPKLLQAIVSSSRPGAPGLKVSTGTVGGKPVTKAVFPGSSVLYLYPRGERVFYVGTQTESVAALILATFP